MLEEEKKGTFTSPLIIGLRNFTVVRIDPNGNQVTLDWKAYNVRNGNAFNIPFEIIELKSGNEMYLISDKKAGNNELMINSTLYQFNSNKQQLLIRFGEGISIEGGGNYKGALKQYEITQKQLNP